ncbi:MAG: topoisomerase IV [Ruminococcaceae bacterium]|nr:topoisomerase IV [Oscillospiraceae bacterium]
MDNLHIEQQITRTLEENYMPYAMSVIISRAIPEIDGFKPSHRKLLYTMYKMGLINNARTKSANVVGQTMKLNPHGDQAIYETMVRLSRGHQALLHPFVDSKGNFGKAYSRDMAYAASRYTEVKLDPICTELFADIDKDTVEFVDNYDNSMKEPTLLPTTYPNVLVNANQGIAVGMASNICSFNLSEVCKTAIEYIKNPEHIISSTLIAPDFSTGGTIIMSHDTINEIYRTGRGSFKVRAKYTYDKKENCIEITEIPYTTTVEAIMDKISELYKAGSLKEISDIRDETDLKGLKITIDLKRGVDADKLMTRLYKQTPLQDSFPCNFNILVGGMPRVMGIAEILEEWTAFRTECIKRQVFFDLNKKKEKLHLLYGLREILLDIDKAIRIVRETEEEAEVIPNLMIGFGIDEVQAEYIAEIKLRNLNKEYILKRIDETEQLEKDIADLEETLQSKAKIRKIIIKQLEAVDKKFGTKRLTDIVYQDEIEEYSEESNIEDYPVTVFITKSGYFKKITPLSLRMGGEHKLKEGDTIAQSFETTNKAELIVFTDKFQAYKAHLYDFADSKASVLGEYLPSVMHFEEGENVVFAVVTTDYKGYLCVAFRNGKVAKVELSSYATKTNRKKLINAYSSKEEAVAFLQLENDCDLVLHSSNGKVLIVNTGAIAPKASRDTQGVAVMTQKGKNYLFKMDFLKEDTFKKPDYYRTKTLPAVGCFLKGEDQDNDQLTL